MNTSNYTLDLKTDIKFLKGVGPKRAQVLYQNDIHTVLDLIRYYPRKYLDRTNIKTINQIRINEKVVIIGTIESFGVKRLKRGKYFQVLVKDKTGFINCIWFHGVSWIMEKFKEGDNIAIYGKVEFYKGYRIIHPEFDILDESHQYLLYLTYFNINLFDNTSST